MAVLFIVLFVAFIAFGWWMILQHDTSRNESWHRNIYAVLGVCSVVIGTFGILFSLGEIY